MKILTQNQIMSENTTLDNNPQNSEKTSLKHSPTRILYQTITGIDFPKINQLNLDENNKVIEKQKVSLK